MITDLDIWRSARTIMQHHGADAETVAAMRAGAFLEDGNIDGHAMWMRILRAIKNLRRDHPARGEGRH